MRTLRAQREEEPSPWRMLKVVLMGLLIGGLVMQLFWWVLARLKE